MAKKKCECAAYGPTVLRVLLGLLFLAPGIMKLMDPSGIIGMLGGMNFPAATLFGWLIILAEVVCGAALILGWKVKFAVWPLLIILVVATIMVHIPNRAAPMGYINILFHLVGLAGLISVYLTGPGAYSVKK